MAKKIQEMAVKEGLTTSSMIRKMIGLDFSPPKRPRLTVSLSQEDYENLGKKYKIPSDDNLEIKRRINKELTKLVKN